MKTYFIHTFGCQMNVHESEMIAGILRKKGYEEGESAEKADVVVFNTCTIRESADKKIESHIGNLKQSKKLNKNKIIIVCGCMTQLKDNAYNLHQKFPYIDIILGTQNLADFENLFDKCLEAKKSIIELRKENTKLVKDMPCYRTSGTNAWVNITYGCNNFCTYCIVPYVRGREVSVPMEQIIDEIKFCLESGYKQITLLGQNVNSYGNDIGDNKTTFSNLLKEIDKLPYKFRLRFMTSHPKDLTDEVIDTIAKSKHICHGIHLPVQSGSNEILAKMNRKYTREHYLEVVKKIKKALPDAELTTDIIVGFPNETEDDFNDTIDLIKKVKYQQIFGFIYSKRRGTVAEKMDNQIPLNVKKERLAKLIEIEREIASNISSGYVGKTVEVLIEGTTTKYGKEYFVGSTDGNKNVNILVSDAENVKIGDFINVEITSSKLTVLYGKKV